MAAIVMHRARTHTRTHTYTRHHHHHHRGRKAHNWTEVSVDNEARPHTCQTPGISLDWPLKSSSLGGSGGQESEQGTNGKKRVCYREDPCQHECSVEPPKLAQPPRLRWSTHLTSLHCKSSGVKDSRQR